MQKIVLLLSLISFALLGCAGEQKESIKERTIKYVGEAEFRQVIESQDVILLDCRPVAEYNEGYIAGSICIDINGGNFDKWINMFNKDVLVAIY